MSVSNGASTLRRSQIYRWHDAHDAVYARDPASGLVQHYGEGAGEADAARRLALCDLSLLPRGGYKGAGAVAWLARHVTLPVVPNQAVASDGGGLVARLSHEEILIIDPPAMNGEPVAGLARSFAQETPPRTWELLRGDSHCLLALAGTHAATVMAKICAIDLRPTHFACGAVAQTSVARVTTIVVRTLHAATPVYYLLTDVSATQYLWECLIDELDADDGRVVGVAALNSLSA